MSEYLILSFINMQKFRFNKYLYKSQKKTNQCLNSNEFQVKDVRLQLTIFSFLLHLTQVFVSSLILQDCR